MKSSQKTRRFFLPLILWMLFFGSRIVCADQGEPFSKTIPDGMGICIWGATDEMLDGLHEAGFRWAGDAFFWSACETEQGKYDFSSYEQMIDLYRRHGFRLFIGLSGGNELYEKADTASSPYGKEMVGWVVPKSEIARKALVRWAVETIRHFKGQGVVWFLFGEPEAIGLSPAEYCWFNEEVGKIIKKELPGEFFAGPGTAAEMSGLPATVTNPKYLEGCIKAGCVKYWDILIFQTYLWDAAQPEEVAQPLDHARKITARYSRAENPFPISTTLGYPSNASEGWIDSNEEKQAKMLARIFLTDQLNGVAITNWYNHQEYNDVSWPEWNFYGLYRKPDANGQGMEPKPAYFAAKAFSSILRGYRFSRRLDAGGPENYLLEFTNGAQTRYAAWTRSVVGERVNLPLKDGAYQVFSHLGDKVNKFKAENSGCRVKLTDAPIYLAPERLE